MKTQLFTPAAALALFAGSVQTLAAGPFPASFNLSSLNGANGFVLKGAFPGDQSGVSVSSAFDVNGDGFGDLIIGASGADPNGHNNAGASYVVFGGVGLGAGGSTSLGTLSGSNGFVLNGVDASDFSGNSVSTAGDVNGDGINDLIIGAFSANPNGRDAAGKSYVVFGAAGLGMGGSIELSTLNGANGFVLNGIDSGDYSGGSVSSAGDVNGDGFNDLIIGAFSANPNGRSAAGESFVVFGAAGIGAGGSIELSTLNGANGFVLNGIDNGDLSGRSVSSAGDVNGDGIDDLVIGSLGADPNGQLAAGESYVVYGDAVLGAGGVLNLSSLNGANGFVLTGIDSGDYSGSSVSSAGDVNGDGIDDLIIGADNANPNGTYGAGESYVVYGAVNLGAGGVLNLSSLNGANGFVLTGIDSGDHSGSSVSSAGDVNGDGIDDLIIGALGADPNGWSAAGKAFVIFGAAGLGASGVFDLSALNGDNGFVLNGIDAGDVSGFSVSSAGDVNGDGLGDLLIGAPNAGIHGGINRAGKTYVVFVLQPNPADLDGDRLVGVNDLAQLVGNWGPCPPSPTACPADLNGDGVVNVFDLAQLVGSWGPTP